MFIPKRHIIDMDDLTDSEFSELKLIKKMAIDQYHNAHIKWPSGIEANLFSYTWRIRDGGFDSTFEVSKSMHLHLHMWPEQDGLMSSITDPEAYTWDTSLLRVGT